MFSRVKLFSRSIETLDLKPTIDETGLAEYEKATLRHAWKFLETESQYHSEQVFLAFFSKYPKYISTFHRFGRKDDNEVLHAHPLWVLESVGRLIEQGLEDIAKFNSIVMQLVKSHEKRNLKGKDIYCMTNTLNKHFRKVLRPHMTPTLKNSLDKLLQKIVEAFG